MANRERIGRLSATSLSERRSVVSVSDSQIGNGPYLVGLSAVALQKANERVSVADLWLTVVPANFVSRCRRVRLRARTAGFVLLSTLLAGCPLDDDSDGDRASGDPPSTDSYSVSANVTGLSGSVPASGFAAFVLTRTDSGGAQQTSSLLVQEDGLFTFPDLLLDGDQYVVSFRDASDFAVRCDVTNGSGVIAAANVTDVAIACTPSYTLSGPVHGLQVTAFTGMVVEVLQNGAVTVPYNTGFKYSDNSFFSGGSNGFLPGDTYDVQITTQPVDEDKLCVVRNGTGTFGAADITNVEIHCTDVSVEYSVTGLIGSGLVVALNTDVERNGDIIPFDVSKRPIAENGNYSFRDKLLRGDRYEVVVREQPDDPDQECIVENGSGIAPDEGDVTGVRVICPTPHREFQFDNEISKATQIPLLSGAQSGGVLYRTFDFGSGPSVPLGSISGFSTSDLFQVHIDNGSSGGVVYSNSSGKTFWVAAVSPSGVRYPQRGASHHNITELTTWWLFRKEADTANLQLEVSEVYMLGFDDTHARDASGRLYGEAQLWVSGYMKSGAGVYDQEFFSRHGGVALQGKLIAPDGNVDWSLFTAVDPAATLGLWSVNDFFFDLIGDEAGLVPEKVALAFLANSIPIPIDVSQIPVGTEFYVKARALVIARNSFSPEGGTAVFLRDPATFEAGDPDEPEIFEDAGSVRLVAAEGLRLLAIDGAPQAGLGAGGIAPAACESGERSTLEFGDALYTVDEGAENSTTVQVTRSGIPAGLVTARVQLTANTAAAGEDFVADEIEVRFGDLDNLPRTLTLPLIDDDTIEPDETFTVSLIEPQGCAEIGPQSTALVTVTDDDTPPGPQAYTLGGTVTGLLGSGLVLTNLSTNALPIDSDGPFAFARTFGSGSRYEVRIQAQPENPRQFCEVANGSGTVTDADITDVTVRCESLPADGTVLDPSFGNDGRAAAGTFPGATAIALQGDGKIVLLGPGRMGRYDSDGNPDSTFGMDGEVPVQFYDVTDKLNAVAVQPDGRIVIAGYARSSVNSPTQEDFVAARFNANGVADVTFGGGGQVVTDFESRGDGGYGVLLQSDGKVVVTGNASVLDAFGGSDANFAAMRYTPAGVPDSSFDTDGRTNADFPGAFAAGYASALQPDGKIVIAGRVAASGGADPDIGLARFNANGSLDATFGSGGVVHEQTTDWDEAADVVLQPDGRIVVVGLTISAATASLIIGRYNIDGTPDTSFGTGGRVVEPLIEVGRAIALQPDGSIVVAGRQAGDFALARYSHLGVPDAGFGANGVVEIDFFGGIDDPAALAIQPDGRIVVAGSARNGTNTVLGLARIVP